MFYCHGLPGSDAEIAWLLERGPCADPIVTLSRTAAGRDQPDWTERLLANFDTAAGRQRGAVRIVAFSLGAMAGLHLAALRPRHVASLDLISPAAPLELGHFLPDMAGRAVFSAARAGALPLSALSLIQRAGLAIAPGALIEALFSTASASERALLDEPRFTGALRQGLQQCLGRDRAAYCNELRTYVRPWAEAIDRVGCPVRLWHGTEDTWAPPAMSVALVGRLGLLASLTCLDGLGHYGTLRHVLPPIAADVA